MIINNLSSDKTKIFLFFICFFILIILSFYNFLLFHSLLELFSIIVAIIIFIIALYSKNISQNYFLIFLGIAYGFVGSFDLLHTLAYKGMGVFEKANTDLPTQLWIIARYLESFSLLFSFIFINRKKKFKFTNIYILFSLISITLFCLLYIDFFPVCHIEGSGLTLFKVISEYIISLILITSLLLLKFHKRYFTDSIYKLISYAIIFTIISEISFTFYIDVYGISNILGHLLKLISFYLIFKAIIETGFKEPYDLLFYKLNQQKILTQSILDSLSAHIAVLDEDGVIKYTNKAWKDFARNNSLSPEKCSEGINYLAICEEAEGESSNKAPDVIRGIKEVIKKNTNLFTLEYPCHSTDKKRWFNMRVTPFKGESPYAVVVAHENITKRKLKEKEVEKEKEKIKYYSFHDQITDLYNRRYFENEIEKLNQSRRLPISIIVADMDGLKKINDNYGHKMGDKYIKKAGEVFNSITRNEDIVARIGGDEFAVILPETDTKTAKKVCNRIKNRCEWCNENSDLPLPLNISLGFATATKENHNLNNIFKKADHNMYQNKKNH